MFFAGSPRNPTPSRGAFDNMLQPHSHRCLPRRNPRSVGRCTPTVRRPNIAVVFRIHVFLCVSLPTDLSMSIHKRGGFIRRRNGTDSLSTDWNHGRARPFCLSTYHEMVANSKSILSWICVTANCANRPNIRANSEPPSPLSISERTRRPLLLATTTQSSKVYRTHRIRQPQ